jgi:hypothetical protein
MPLQLAISLDLLRGCPRARRGPSSRAFALHR